LRSFTTVYLLQQSGTEPPTLGIGACHHPRDSREGFGPGARSEPRPFDHYLRKDLPVLYGKKAEVWCVGMTQRSGLAKRAEIERRIVVRPIQRSHLRQESGWDLLEAKDPDGHGQPV